MKSKLLVKFFGILAMMVFAAPLGWASAITINNVTDTPFHFRTVVTGVGVGALDETHQLNDLAGTPWESNSTIFEDSGFTFDAMTVSWNIRHLVGPHAIDVNPNPVLTNLSVAFTAPGGAGTIVVEDTDMVGHPLTTGGTHPNVFRLTLSVTSSASRDITGYIIVYDAFHVPEPSSVVLFGLGTAVLFGYGWRRRKGTGAVVRTA